MKTVSVMPAGKGWVVSSDAIDNDLYFQSGAKAERAARRIAEAVAAAGEAAQMIVHMKNGEPAGRFVVPPIAKGEPVPA